MSGLIYAGDAGIFKTCSRCGETKSSTDFGRRPERPSGLRPKCQECQRALTAEYRERNPARAAEYYLRKKSEDPDYFARNTARYRDRHPERVADENMRTKAARDADREAYRALERERYVKSRDRIAARRARKRAENLEHARAKEAEKRRRNPEREREKSRIHCKKRRSSAKGKLENSIRTGFYRGLVNGAKAGRKTFDLLGYSAEDLRVHLERQFQPGMSWDNYGKGGWEIDHRVPLSAHNYNTPDDYDFKRAWALKNLRPMWASDNRSKHARLDAPFQPTLAFGC